jgi:hypothetical protein
MSREFFSDIYAIAYLLASATAAPIKAGASGEETRIGLL